MEVTLLGTSGTLQVPGRPLTSLHVSVKNKSVLFDCGEGTQLGFTRLKLGLKRLSVICLTHYHADHILGLPGLIATINMFLKCGNVGNRDLLIIGPPDTNHILRNILNAVQHPYVRISTYFVSGHGKRVLDFDGFSIEVFPVRHSVPCVGYNLIEKNPPHIDLEKAISSGVDTKYFTFLQKGLTIDLNGEVKTISDISSGRAKYYKISYVTDTIYFKELSNYVRGANLAILEGSSYGKLVSSDSLGAHMSYADAATIARHAHVRELWLTHFNPRLTTPMEGLSSIKGIFSNVKCGRFGMNKCFGGN